MKRSGVALSAFALLTICSSTSCSTGTPGGSQPVDASSTQQSSAPRPIAHVGDTLNLARIGEGQIAVLLMQIINPATVRDGLGDLDKTYVATRLTITNTGTSTIVGDANNDVSLVGSDDQIYPADFTGVTECTNFTYGQFLLAVNQSVTGCVTFALPPGVTPVKVKYAPSSGISHDVGEWLNP